MEIGLIITAAGSGERFGKKSKVLIPINGEPLLIHTIKQFQNYESIKKIIITLHPDQWETVTQHPINQEQKINIILGGKTRTDSVYLAYQAMQDCSHVMIHDGARPLVTKALIDRIIAAGKHHKAVIPGLPVTDTLKAVNNQTIKKTISRKNLYHIQTPQLFDYHLLKEAYDLHLKPVTDEAALIEEMTHPIHFVDGDRHNIKLTYPEDIAILQSYLNARKLKQQTETALA